MFASARRTVMPTLGDRLRQANENRKDAAVRAQEARRKLDDETRQRNERTVRNFLNDAQQAIERHIMADEKVPEFRVPNRADDPFRTYTWRKDRLSFADVMPDYRDITQEFDIWMRTNGLVYDLEARHDGFGLEGWYVIVVRAA